MIDSYKIELEQQKIDHNCVIKTFLTKDERYYILQLNYMGGKYVAEKTYSNNMIGVGYMEEFKQLYRNEYDFKKYFGFV
jgi:hypothetical protein